MSTGPALALTFFVASLLVLAVSLWMLHKARQICEGAQRVLTEMRHDRRRSVQPWFAEERRHAAGQQ